MFLQNVAYLSTKPYSVTLLTTLMFVNKSAHVRDDDHCFEPSVITVPANVRPTPESTRPVSLLQETWSGWGTELLYASACRMQTKQRQDSARKQLTVIAFQN